MQDQCEDCMNTRGDLIYNAKKYVTFRNRIITGDETLFSVRFTTEVKTGHLEITFITKKEETITGKVKRQGNA
jgi:hypothetical protein